MVFRYKQSKCCMNDQRCASARLGKIETSPGSDTRFSIGRKNLQSDVLSSTSFITARAFYGRIFFLSSMCFHHLYKAL